MFDTGKFIERKQVKYYHLFVVVVKTNHQSIQFDSYYLTEQVQMCHLKAKYGLIFRAQIFEQDGKRTFFSNERID